MNIERHRLDDPVEPSQGGQNFMNIAGHDLWLRELEEEFEASFL